MWVLGIEFMSFAKAINAINCSAHLYASKVMGFIMVPSYTCVLMPCSYLPPSLLLLPNIAGPFLCPNSNYPVCFYITCILSHYHMFLCLPLYRLHTLSSYHVFSIIMSYVGAIYVAHINNCAYINLLFVFLNRVYFASLNDLHFNPFFCQCHDFMLFWGD